SPIGKALLGHKAGEKVEAQTPAGVLVFEVVSVE
ncbi:MAG: GreA/GreB family elongation factor, partial [Anaerolineales bacterium]|nr:GreA/GreB family elongation factor [Anaerolineales bacterium]